MRLLERNKQTLTLKPPMEKLKYNPQEHLYRFDGSKAVSIRAVVQPMSGYTAAQLYGTTIHLKRRLLYDGETLLTLGMGVCVDVPHDQPCDYRIEETPAKWSGHWNAVLAYLPPEQRGGT